MTDETTAPEGDDTQRLLDAANEAVAQSEHLLLQSNLELERSPSQTRLFEALCNAQADFDTIQATADNEYFHSKYAPLYALWELARPILKKHGLVFIQEPMPSTIEEGAKLRNTLAHTSGEWRSSVIVMPIDLGKEGKGKKAPAFGAAYSYARRYGMGGILGLVTSAEDTDASQSDPNYSTESSAAAEGWKSWAEFMCKKMREVTSRLELEKLATETKQRLENQEVPDIVPDLIQVTYERRKAELAPAKGKGKGIDDIDVDEDIPQ